MFLSIDGAVQALGIALLITGAVLEDENHPDHPAFAVLPMLGDGLAGVMFTSEL